MKEAGGKKLTQDDHRSMQTMDALYWAETLNGGKGICFGTQHFSIEGHEYEKKMVREKARVQVKRKGAQLGITQIELIRKIHGMIYNYYPQGVLYLFPTHDDVTKLSRGRIDPLIGSNPEISRYVQEISSVDVKKVNRSMFYLMGARPTHKIAGEKESSAALKSYPVDSIVFDEFDEMEPAMVDLALERMSHSKVKEESYLSTPSIPGFGVDLKYQESDQRIWMIRCKACGGETCLEMEFPECVKEGGDGKWFRACKKCGAEIFPRDGHWVAQYPEKGKDVVGWWISQLNSIFVDPGKILKAYLEPPNNNLAEVYNSKLGMAYIAAENRLTVNDIYACCGNDGMGVNHPGPCAMGVDVGGMLNVVVGFRKTDKQLQVCHLARVSSFNDVHDIAKRFNVKFAVVDAEPELRKAQEFSNSEGYPVFLCDYQVSLFSDPVEDEEKRTVKVNRNWVCDATHGLITASGLLIMPRRNAEVEVYAKQMSNTAKKLQEDKDGSRRYVYIKLGPDHYYHATNYFWLAAKQIPVYVANSEEQRLKAAMKANKEESYDPLTFGLGVN